MDDDKIIDVTEVTQKKPWYKRLWGKVTDAAKTAWEWTIDHAYEIGSFLLGVIIGLWTLCIGYLLGLLDRKNNEANYEEGRKKGYNEGYVDCTKDIKQSGYQMYGGYGEDADKVIIKKVVEVPLEETHKQD